MQRPDHITVLIVDDEALIRLMVADELTDHGIATLEAEDADEALVLLRTSPEISVLFTDINMPGAMNGVDLAHEVAAQRPDIRIFLASGRERPIGTEIPVHANFVQKPYNARLLANLIHSSFESAIVNRCND